MGMLDDILNAKARMEEFTPDIPFAIYAHDPQDVVNYCIMTGVTDISSIPVYTIPALPEGVFAIETGSYLLVVDMHSQQAAKVDCTSYSKDRSDIGDRVTVIHIAYDKLKRGELT